MNVFIEYFKNVITALGWILFSFIFLAFVFALDEWIRNKLSPKHLRNNDDLEYAVKLIEEGSGNSYKMLPDLRVKELNRVKEIIEEEINKFKIEGE